MMQVQIFVYGKGNNKNYHIFTKFEMCLTSCKGSVWFLFLRTVFENTKNTILVFFGNSSCYQSLVFYVFSMFFRTKNY